MGCWPTASTPCSEDQDFLLGFTCLAFSAPILTCKAASPPCQFVLQPTFPLGLITHSSAGCLDLQGPPHAG
jgi:hypothetical protein